MSARVLFAAGLLVTLAAVGCRTAPIQNVYASALALAQNIRKTVDLYPANEGTQGSAAGEG